VALKRHPALQEYSKEHHDELLFVWKIREGLKKDISPERIIDFIKYQYNASTSLHMAQEEKYILDKLPQHDADKVKILHEHEALKDMIQKISISTTDKVKMLSEFADALDKHIRFEERIFFPRLQDSLAEDIIMSMKPSGSKVKQDKQWEDAFWVK
jgi:hemerythrin-like domain-containing protein